MFFFFNDTATTEIYTLSLHDALPILGDDHPFHHAEHVRRSSTGDGGQELGLVFAAGDTRKLDRDAWVRLLERRQDLEHRSEEHTSELQSRQYLVCRLLLEKKKTIVTL